MDTGSLIPLIFLEAYLRTRKFKPDGKTKLETGEYGLSVTRRADQLW